jgi:hypothetical protein
MYGFFYFLLTMCLITIFVNDQLDARFFFWYLFFSNSLHVSINQVLIIRRVNCINTTSGILVYVTLCRWPCGMQVWMELFHVVITFFTNVMHKFFIPISITHMTQSAHRESTLALLIIPTGFCIDFIRVLPSSNVHIIQQSTLIYLSN